MARQVSQSYSLFFPLFRKPSPLSSTPFALLIFLPLLPSSPFIFNSFSPILLPSQRSQMMQQHILPELEDRLKKKCEAIAAFYEPNITELKFSFAKSSLLHGVISKRKAKQEREERLLALDRANTERAFWDYFKVFFLPFFLTAIYPYPSSLTSCLHSDSDKIDKIDS
jgi:hypothetical protein